MLLVGLEKELVTFFEPGLEPDLKMVGLEEEIVRFLEPRLEELVEFLEPGLVGNSVRSSSDLMRMIFFPSKLDPIQLDRNMWLVALTPFEGTLASLLKSLPIPQCLSWVDSIRIQSLVDRR